MPTIDRYILRLFLTNFIILLAVLLVLIVVVDLVATLDEFVQAAQNWADERGGIVWSFLYAIADYYGPLLLRIIVMVTGLVATGAMGFTFFAMAKQRELVVVITSGVSLYRVAAPVLVAAAVLNVLVLPIQEYVLPPLAPKLVRPKVDIKRTEPRTTAISYARDSSHSLLSAGDFRPDLASPKLSDVVILTRSDTGQAIRRITAAEAVWEEQRHGWELINGYAIRPTYDRDPLASPEPPKPQPVFFFATDLTPDVLRARRDAAYPQLLGIKGLLDLARNQAADSRLITHIMHSRVSSIAVNMLILVMALRFVLVRLPTDLAASALRASAVCIPAWGVGLLLTFYSIPWLNPAASAWLPVVVLLPLSAAMLAALRS